MPAAKRSQALRWLIARTLLAAGVPLRLHSAEREVFERDVLSYFARSPDFRRVLFVGCDWYTKVYERLFRGKEYTTIEIDAARRPFGAKQHIVGSLADLGGHVGPGELDLILCNGVFGWGLDSRDDASRAFAACAETLRVGGVLVLGWDDVAEHRPFEPNSLPELQRMRPWIFPPAGSARLAVGQHMFDFYAKSTARTQAGTPA